MVGSSQPEFMKGKTLIKLIAFYDEMTSSVVEGRLVDIVYLDFNKVFHPVSHNILIYKLRK